MKYDDIITLPHHVSSRRKPMPRADRAAQFSPFAALSGFDGAVDETARQTEPRRELDEDMKGLLDRKIQLLAQWTGKQPDIWITYFIPDPLKPGGQYRTAHGKLWKLDLTDRMLWLTETGPEGEQTVKIAARDIYTIESSLFPAGW